VFGPIFFWCAFVGKMAHADSTVAPQEPPHTSSPSSVGHELGIGVTGAFVRGTSIQADGSTANAAAYDVGGQADYLMAFPHYLRPGVGFRYAYGAGTNDQFHLHDVEHIAFVPFLLGVAWWPRSRQELEVVAGIGPVWSRFTSTSVGFAFSSSFDTFGLGVELTATYAFFLSDHLALFAGISGRASFGSNTRTPAAPILGEGAFHGEVPVLGGVRIRL
jgi:hypothetical protein